MTRAGYGRSMVSRTTVGPLLKEWRSHRRMSQLALATAADVSQRHISFVESGRSTPSRDLLLHLARAMDVPLRDQNLLLTAAGYARVFTESDYDAADLAPLRAAVDAMLAGVEPYPAMAIDRLWNVHRINDGAAALFGALVGPDAPVGEPLNLARLVFHPDGVRRRIRNFAVVGAVLLDRIDRDVMLSPDHHEMSALRDELMAYPGVAEIDRRGGIEAPPAFSVELVLDTDRGLMRFFTTLASVGSPTDVTAQELSVEFYFPLDDATDTLLRHPPPTA